MREGRLLGRGVYERGALISKFSKTVIHIFLYAFKN